MAVRAQDAQVSQPVVVPSAIDMVELEKDLAAVPGVAKTTLAPVFLQPPRDESLLQPIRLKELASDE
jgi:hypothetical protein